MPRKRTERKRCVHTRSRNGCFTCKAKHLRCDEQKPLCGRCLATGGSCGYPTDQNAQYTSPNQQAEVTIKKESFYDDFSCDLDDISMPNHMLVGYPVEMPLESRVLFDLFARHRGVFRRDISPESHAFLVSKALSSPPLLHSALLCSAMRWTWMTGNMCNIQKSVLYHQLEVIKHVNEAMKNPLTAVNDETISSIASLAMVESGLGHEKVANAHLNGLFQILALRNPAVARQESLLQSMILSSSQGLCQMTIHEAYGITQLPSAAIAKLTASSGINTFQVFVAPYVEAFRSHPKRGAKTEQSDSGFAKESTCRTQFSNCWFYLWILLGVGDLDMFLLNWFIEALIDDLVITEQSMLLGEFPRHVWFWGAMLARVAGTSARPSNTLELQQVAEWEKLTCAKVRLSSQTLEIKTWEEAKAVLKSFVWRDGLLDEEALRRMWEDAMLVKVW